MSKTLHTVSEKFACIFACIVFYMHVFLTWFACNMEDYYMQETRACINAAIPVACTLD